ncbi:MAG: hypothetical protein WD649_06130 [Thermoleophilaceae bacterium]
MRTRLRSRLCASLLVLLALALGLVACGGDDNEENVDQLLDKAFTTAIESADVTLDTEIGLEGADIDGPIKVKLSGPFKDNGPAKVPSFDFDVSVGGGGLNAGGGLVSSGDNLFVSFQDENYELGEGLLKQVNEASKQVQEEQGKDGGSLKGLGIDPRGWVKNGKEEGTEDVAGVETTHITAELDVPKMLNDLNELVEKSGDQLGGTLGPAPEPLSEDQIKQIEDIVKDPKFDVYVGKDDDVLRRLSTDLEFEVPEGDRDDIGLEKGDVSFSIQFADVGDPVEIKAPTDARPISQLLNQLLPGLGSQIPGLGGDSGGSGSSGGSGLVPPSSTSPDSGSTPPATTGPTPEVREKLQKFQQCVRDADPSDTMARQKCLDLLK